MARARSPEKRNAILEAAVHEIAESGLGASTANIARRAGIAAGTLFTYFATKEELLNELYLQLKEEVLALINTDFPQTASLERRVKHIWLSSLHWAIQFPKKRKVSLQLTVSDLVTPAIRIRVAEGRTQVEAILLEVERRGGLRTLPRGFASATMSAIQDATIEFAAKNPKKRDKIIEQAFQVLWRALK